MRRRSGRGVGSNSSHYVAERAPESLAGVLACGAIRVPVGPATLGRVFNALGEPLDGLPIPTSTERWPIHRSAEPTLALPRRKATLLETGIKVIDLLAPVAAEDTTGIIGGGGVWSKENAEAMLAAGAMAVQVDAVLWGVGWLSQSSIE